jgi:hypothetical protein
MTGNGQVERIHYCRGCGHWLIGTTVPLGTPGIVRVVCQERQCSRTNHVRIGEEPLSRPDRESWIVEMRRRRARATTF